MPKKKITRVTAETHQVLIVRKTRRSVRAWCESCGAQGEMLSLEQAAAISGLSLRGICRAVEAGSIHFKETGDGSLLICLDSLLKLRKEGEK
ncbi:MAG: hypothetical protein M3362_07975 [Acidobacteriota bacterium]|nr:hypothetical protein [Acidobacteriota bacterium]